MPALSNLALSLFSRCRDLEFSNRKFAVRPSLFNSCYPAKFRGGFWLASAKKAAAFFAATALVSAAALVKAEPDGRKDPPLELFIYGKFPIANVSLSTEGTYLAMLVKTTMEGRRKALRIYRTDEMQSGGTPFTIGTEKLDIRGHNWVNDDTLLVSVVQYISQAGGRESAVDQYYLVKAFEKSEWVEILPRKGGGKADLNRERPRFIGINPVRPNRFYVVGEAGSGLSVLEINSRNGKIVNRLLRLPDNLAGTPIFDRRTGQPRLANFQSANGVEIVTRYQLAGKSDWQTLYVTKAATLLEQRVPESAALAQGHPDYAKNPNLVYVTYPHDKVDGNALYLYDLSDGQLPEDPDLARAAMKLLYVPEESFDPGWLSSFCNNYPWEQKTIGYSYFGDWQVWKITDGYEKQLIDFIDASIAGSVGRERINQQVSRACDENRRPTKIIVRSFSPIEPAQWFYFAKDEAGRWTISIALDDPLDNTFAIAEPKVRWFTARDGMRIQALVTLPVFGEPPWPVIAMPHGGPWARDVVTNERFAMWPQLLANAGYAVIQPNFRGSTGLGISYWRAGDNEWGGKMQGRRRRRP